MIGQTMEDVTIVALTREALIAAASRLAPEIGSVFCTHTPRGQVWRTDIRMPPATAVAYRVHSDGRIGDHRAWLLRADGEYPGGLWHG